MPRLPLWQEGKMTVPGWASRAAAEQDRLSRMIRGLYHDGTGPFSIGWINHIRRCEARSKITRRRRMPQSLACAAPCSSTRETRRTTRLCDIPQTPDGQGRIRTYAGLRQWVYSPSPLAARAPVRLLPGRINRGQAPLLNGKSVLLSTRPHEFFHSRVVRVRLDFVGETLAAKGETSPINAY